MNNLDNVGQCMFNLDKQIKRAASTGIHLSRFNCTLSALFQSCYKTSWEIYRTYGMWTGEIKLTVSNRI